MTAVQVLPYCVYLAIGVVYVRRDGNLGGLIAWPIIAVRNMVRWLREQHRLADPAEAPNPHGHLGQMGFTPQQVDEMEPWQAASVLGHPSHVRADE